MKKNDQNCFRKNEVVHMRRRGDIGQTKKIWLMENADEVLGSLIDYVLAFKNMHRGT